MLLTVHHLGLSFPSRSNWPSETNADELMNPARSNLTVDVMIASVLRGKPTAKGVTYLASHTNIDFSILISCRTEFEQLKKI